MDDLPDELPDDLKASVVSFLESRIAVKLSFASKAYESVWSRSSSVNLRLPISDIFLQKFLQERAESEIHDFTVKVSERITKEQFEVCFIYAVEHKLQTCRLEIDQIVRVPITMPIQLFRSSTIRELYLSDESSFENIQFPKFPAEADSSWLPNLKLLSLGLKGFEISSLCSSLFQNLEVLILKKCGTSSDTSTYHFNFSKLERFEFHCIPFSVPSYAIEIFCPSLNYFFLRGALAVKFSNPPKKEAFLDLQAPEREMFLDLLLADVNDYVYTNIGEILCNLGPVMHGVHTLSLTTSTIKHLTEANLKFQDFSKLKRLNLITRRRCNGVLWTSHDTGKRKRRIERVERRIEVLSTSFIKDLQKLGANVEFDKFCIIPDIGLLMEGFRVDEIHLGVVKREYEDSS